VQEAKSATSVLAQLRQIFSRNFEQRERAYDVGLDERRRIVNRAINVRFSREIDHRRRLVFVEDRSHRVFVGDVRFDEMNAGTAQRVFNVRQIAGVCQFINDDEPGVGSLQSVAREVRAYEPGAACNNHRVNQV
jgi:hypothetical protein